MARSEFNRSRQGSRKSQVIQRPVFMETLGLLPPYSTADIKQAYKLRARLAHPDLGGSVDDFLELRDAYDLALEYVQVRGDRRQWIAAMANRWKTHEQLVGKLEALGAELTVSSLDWLQKSFGDFAILAESIESIRLVNSKNGLKCIDLLAENASSLNNLKTLDLQGSGITDEAVLRLRSLPRLQSIDVSHNSVTDESLKLIEAVPTLTNFVHANTSIRLWQSARVAMRLRKRRESAKLLPSVN